MLFGIWFLNLDILSAIVFVFLMCLYLYHNRKRLSIQRGVSLGKIPIVYVLLLRLKAGLRLMDRIAEKFREEVKLFGYIGIGVGFIGMLLVTFLMVFSVFLLIFRPDIQNGAALLIPFTTIPGLGYLSFWHFLISIFFIATIHEFAHGVVSRAHDVPVDNSGVGALGIIVPFIPLAFVEPDENVLKKKDDVVQYSVFAAGPFINIIAGILIFLLFALVFTPIQSAMIQSDGFSFTTINQSLPAYQSGMRDSTIISLNGQNITDFYAFQDKLACVTPGEELTIGTTQGTYNVTTTSSPADPKKGFIGIRPVENVISLKPKYKGISGPFFWIKGLIQWLYRLSLLVGIFNLLPVLFVDGGRMFQIAVKRIVPDDRKGNRVIGFIAFVLITIILVLLLWTYLPKLAALVMGAG